MAASIGAALNDVTRVDRRELAVAVALRAATGMAVVLVAGLASGHTLQGVTAAIGALAGGFASRQGTYRSRATAVLAASSGMAVSAVVGGLLGHVEGPDIALNICWGLAAGMLTAFGPVGTVVGVQSVVGLVVFSQFRFTVPVALEQGLLVLAGGLVQTLLVVVVWPLRRFPAERRALGGAFDQLAAAARAVASGGGLPPADVFAGLTPALADPQPFAGEARLGFYRALADQAERSRLELAALGRSQRRLLDAGARRPSATVADVALAAAEGFAEVAEALRQARPPRRSVLAALDQVLRRLPPPPPPHGLSEPTPLDEAAQRCRALAGQVRAAVRLAAGPAGAADTPAASTSPAAPGAPRQSRLGEWRAVLRANLSLSSQALRHAVRLALTLGAAVAVSHLVPLGHRYWLPMTAMIVLKPDFRTTVVRGLSRVAGTLFGAGLVTLAVAELKPDQVWLTVAVVVLYLAAVSLLTANYAIYSACIASLVVLLLAFVGEPAASLAADRALYTTAGAAIALVAYLAWPTWEASTLAARLGGLVETERVYLGAVLGAWVAPENAHPARLQRLRLDARLARINSEAAAQRWSAEPAHPSALSAAQVDGLLAAVRSLMHSVLTLHAWLPADPERARRLGGAGRPQLAALADAFDRALAAVAALLRGGGTPGGTLPPLRDLHAELAALNAEPAAAGNAEPKETAAEPKLGPEAAVLVEETDLLVNAVDTLGHLVGLRRPVNARPPAGPPG